LLLLLQAAAPGGQLSPAQPGSPAFCQASEIASADPGRGPREGAILYVGCGRDAVRIGKVDSYRSSYNPATRSLAVVVHERGRIRVLVAQQDVDGTLQLQDLSRDLAKASGRPFDAGLRAAEVDLGRFAADGSIAASAPGRPGSEGRLNAGHYAPPAQGVTQPQPGTPSRDSPR
jgi:hypothetical protein